MKKYRPSNGTEGEGFMSCFCENCIHDDGKNKLCEIISLTMCLDVDDKDYPEEWTYDEQGNPTCTKFVKWDWDNDGDPDDPENPKAPIPENPNQLCMPFLFNELDIKPIELLPIRDQEVQECDATKEDSSKTA